MSRSWKLTSSLLGSAALLTCLVGGCAELIGLDEPYHTVPKEGGAGGAASVSSGSQSASSSTSAASSTSAGGAGGGGDPLLIDDMEDGAVQVTLPDGSSTIHGEWYVGFDQQNEPKAVITAPQNGMLTGLFQKLPEPRADSHVAVHLAGRGFRAPGPGVEVGIGGSAWDASAFKGLTFWARSGAPECRYFVAMGDKNTEEEAGVCTMCWDAFSRALPLTKDWTQYTIPFDSLHQTGYGVPAETDLYTKALYVLFFHVEPGCAFDLWVDDIYLSR